MASLVSSFLHHSANKIEDLSRYGKKKGGNHDENGLGTRLPQATLSTPTMIHQSYYQHPQASYSAEYIASSPTYDPNYMLMNYTNNHQHPTGPPLGSPVLTPSTSWSTETSTKNSIPDINSGDIGIILDRRSISQGMKLVSIAADEYDEGNETVALDIYLTGLDKILMALPNKTDSKTKMALREKLLSVEERVGILNLANRRTSSANSNQDNGTNTSYNEKEQEQQRRQENLASSLVDTLIISKITQSLQSVKQAAMSRASLKQDNVQTDDYTQQQHNPYHSHQIPSTDIHLDARTPLYQHPYPVNVVEKFKQFGQVLIQASVTLAILIKQSPIPALLSFCFTYFMQLLLWVDAYYGVRQRAQDLSVTGIKLLLQADEQYKLHELLSEFLFMMVAATLKAVVAYKETPRYGSFNMPSTSNEQQFQTLSEPKLKEINNNTDDSNNHLPSTPCASSSSYATLSSWVWSPRR